ncbi:hypothetical protein GCM10020295_19060 [Streptomyces cinereospinus]
MTTERIDPPALSPATGFSHAVVATGSRLVFLAGQTALDRDGAVLGDTLPEQFERALGNLLTALRAAGGTPRTSPASPSTPRTSPPTAHTPPNWAASGGAWPAATTRPWRWSRSYGCGTRRRRWSSTASRCCPDGRADSPPKG